MSKQLREYSLYVAPKIIGQIMPDGSYNVFDERTRRRLDPENLEDKIYIYEREVKGWFLDRALRFLRNDDNEFIVLMIALSYIEGVEEYRRGELSNGRSKEFFTAGLQRIFFLSSVDQSDLEDFYKQVRCGLFHTGMTRKKVVLRKSFDLPIDFSESNTIKISPGKFLREIQNDFDKYLMTLRNPSNTSERDKFDRLYTNI